MLWRKLFTPPRSSPCQGQEHGVAVAGRLGRKADMTLTVFEQDKARVLEALENGDFDYMESASEVVETEARQGATTKDYLYGNSRRSNTAWPTVSAAAVGERVNNPG